MWMLADHQGTIRDLVDGQLGSPTEGEVVNHLTYDAYGQLLDQTASDPVFQTRYGYTGQEFDAETGLMYYNARWYDPRNGRFISEDPIGINGGDYNLSRYVANSPTNGTDPSGLVVWLPILRIGVGIYYLLSPDVANAPDPLEKPMGRRPDPLA